LFTPIRNRPVIGSNPIGGSLLKWFFSRNYRVLRRKNQHDFPSSQLPDNS
jgi:hypothetical protein